MPTVTDLAFFFLYFALISIIFTVPAVPLHKDAMMRKKKEKIMCEDSFIPMYLRVEPNCAVDSYE